MQEENKKDVLSIIIIIFIIIGFLLISYNGVRAVKRRIVRSTYNIVLLGDNPLIVYQGDTYVEPGYAAYNYINKERNDLVKVKSNLDTEVIGKYQISYEINNIFKKNKVVRDIEVIENPLKYVDFSLVGDAIINIERNEKYQELGFNISSDKGDFRKNVTVTNCVDTSKIGMYEVIYTLTIGSKERTIKRLVNVVGDKYSVTLSNNIATNQDITIKLTNNIRDFKHFINPNGIILEQEEIEFTVDKNGVYEFHLVDINNTDEAIEVKITNIDKISPNGVCNAFISQNKTTYKIDASDDSGIYKFTHNKEDYFINSFVVDQIEESGDVYIYDNAGNLSIVSCNMEYEYIAPTTNNYKYQYNSDTLKYWIENAGTYYKTTHIWVKDAYRQIKVAVPNKSGLLQTGKTIINNEINNKNLSKKGLVAINASGIVGGGFGKSFANLTPSWTGTAAIPLIINDGNIVRDSTGIKTPNVTNYTYGIKKNGYLTYYKYGSGDNIEYNQKIKDQIINDGVLYTFGFTPILVYEGKAIATATEKNIRQSICQIDHNNFIIITNTNDTNDRSKGFSFKGMADYMVKLNCKTGFNLDGGGSVNYFYKGNTSTLNNIVTTTRGLADMLYFVEK